MTTSGRVAAGAHPVDHQCGCCGRTLPATRLAELGTTTGVYICTGCGLWAARRAARLPSLPGIAHFFAHAARRLHRSRPDCGDVTSAIPIVASADLSRTSVYWQKLGFEVVERHDSYLVTHAHGVEIHFFTAEPPGAGQPVADTSAPLLFIHVRDAAALWQRLMAEQITGIGPIQDQDYGLREFVVTDPDGNRIRIGTPIHD